MNQERRKREKTELRDKILDATRSLLVEGGPDAVTMREVARLVEYSPAAIYQHFPDKEALIRGVCLRDFAEFAQLFLALPREGGPLAMLARSGFAYIAFARDFPEHYRFMFMTPRVAACPEDEQQKGDPAQNAYVYLHQLIVYAKSTGVLREDVTDMHQAAQTVWALVHGVAALEICRRNSDPWIEPCSLAERALAAVTLATFGYAKDAETAKAAVDAAISGSAFESELRGRVS